MQISIQTLAGCMGKTTEGIKLSLNVSLKGSPKGVFQEKNLNQNFQFKIRPQKTTLLFTQK